MTELAVNEEQDLRCSVQTAALGEPPAGSAGFAQRVLLVELPLPWPNKIDQHPLLVDLDLPADKSTKLLGIRSSEAAELSRHRLIVWERTEPFRGFERAEAIVDRVELRAAVDAAARDGAGALPNPLDIDPTVEDLLICTHGTRDRCCGQLGTRLHIELDCAFNPNVRMWRTSHTGGHRFAPTGIHFPYGTTWSTLDAELTVAIVEQTLPTHRLSSHFRGNLGVDGRPAQIAEGVAFLDQGWDWLGEERQVEVDIHADDTVVATVRSKKHETTVTMQKTESIPVPACGEDLDASTKATPQYRLI